MESESLGVGTGEPFSFAATVVTHNADHLVHVGANLDTACKTNES